MTDAGRKMIEKAPAAPQDYLLAGLNRMPSRDRRQLAKLLARLVKETGMVNLPATMLFEDESPAEGVGGA